MNRAQRLGILLTTVASLTSPAAAADWRATSREVLAELIASPTVSGPNPEDGTTRPVAESLASRFRAAGFPAADVQVLAPDNRPNRANLIVRLRGTGKAKPVLVIGHLDVVPADPKDWTKPPFQLTEDAGYLYGRGTLDMKGEIAAFVTAFLRLKAEGAKPDRDIILALTPDEETGDANGVAWLVQNHRSLIDAGLVLNPDAGGGAMEANKPRWYGVQTAEKTYATWAITTTNKGGHSSRPEPDNAIYQLAAGLLKVQALQFPARLTATTRAWMEARSALETGQFAQDLKALAASRDTLPAEPLKRLTDRLDTSILLRTTCVATQLSGGGAENALPQNARAAIQCRLLPGDTPEAVEAMLKQAIADPQVTLTTAWPADPGPETTPDPAVLARLAKAVHGLHPNLPLIPQMDAGATDGKILRAAGYPVYGVGTIFQDIDDMRAHGRDERIRATRYDEASELAYRMLLAASGR